MPDIIVNELIKNLDVNHQEKSSHWKFFTKYIRVHKKNEKVYGLRGIGSHKSYSIFRQSIHNFCQRII